jgi:hypothetical protein
MRQIGLFGERNELQQRYLANTRVFGAHERQLRVLEFAKLPLATLFGHIRLLEFLTNAHDHERDSRNGLPLCDSLHDFSFVHQPRQPQTLYSCT